MSNEAARPKSPFIVIEGLDGAGTTTQVNLISAQLRSMGLPTWTTREPSGGVIGRAMRQAIEGNEGLSPAAMALGFAADRIHHITRPGGIQQMLSDGVWVISDRYILSSYAYQAAQGVSMDWLRDVNRFAPDPDVTIFVDTPLKTCLTRIGSRGSKADDFFHRRSSLIATRRQYLHALANGDHLGRLVTVDGSPNPEQVAQQALAGLFEVLHHDFGLLAEPRPEDGTVRR